jgi:hypothetical protein
MYKISKLKGCVYFNDIEVIQDDRLQPWNDYIVWLRLGNTPEIVDYVGNELDELKTADFIKKLQTIASTLRIKAKAAAIGKKGDRDYIFSQVELYELKYKVSIGEISNPYIESLMQNEAGEFGITLELFKQLIIYMYTDALSKYQVFMFMIERCRTKIQTLIENTLWEKVATAFTLIETLNDPEQAQEIMSNILAL